MLFQYIPQFQHKSLVFQSFGQRACGQGGCLQCVQVMIAAEDWICLNLLLSGWGLIPKCPCERGGGSESYKLFHWFGENSIRNQRREEIARKERTMGWGPRDWYMCWNRGIWSLRGGQFYWSHIHSKSIDLVQVKTRVQLWTKSS